MNYFQEARLRWKGDTPDWFKKTQKILAAGVVLGGGLAGISVVSSKLSWITVVGGSISALCTGGILVSTFVVTSLNIILEPGATLQNQTDAPVSVKVNTVPDSPEPDQPKEDTTTTTTTDPPPQLP